MLAALVIGTALRIFFAWHQPFTNDEGAYLFDAKLLSQRVVPGGDVLAKAPVPALLFSGSVWMTQGSLFAARLVSVCASLLTILPLFWLTHRLGGKTAAVIAVILWLLIVPFSMQVLGITEPIASVFAVTFLALWWGCLVPDKFFKHQWLMAMAAGIFFGLAFASRKTNIAMLVPALYLWLMAPAWQRNRLTVPVMIGCLLVALPWGIVLYSLYGPVGLSEALGVGYSAIWQEEVSVMTGHGGIGWALTVLARVGSGLSLAALIGFGWVALKVYHKQLPAVWPLLWFLVLVGLYSGWPTFLPEYLIDFFVPVVLMAALALAEMRQRYPLWQRTALGTLLIASAIGVWSAYTDPWTGMFSRQAITEAAAELRKHVPLNESIFTAAVIVPYLTGHEVVFNIAHPLWYRYGFIPSSTKEAFLPPLNVIEDEVRDGETSWALVEHLTDYAYLRNESRLITHFGQHWEIITTTPNDTGFRSNTLKLYRRAVQ